MVSSILISLYLSLLNTPQKVSAKEVARPTEKKVLAITNVEAEDACTLASISNCTFPSPGVEDEGTTVFEGATEDEGTTVFEGVTVDEETTVFEGATVDVETEDEGATVFEGATED